GVDEGPQIRGGKHIPDTAVTAIQHDRDRALCAHGEEARQAVNRPSQKLIVVEHVIQRPSVGRQADLDQETAIPLWKLRSRKSWPDRLAPSGPQFPHVVPADALASFLTTIIRHGSAASTAAHLNQNSIKQRRRPRRAESRTESHD